MTYYIRIVHQARLTDEMPVGCTDATTETKYYFSTYQAMTAAADVLTKAHRYDADLIEIRCGG